MDCSPPGSSVHGILQARILEGFAIAFSRGSSWPRDQTWVSPIAGRFFTIGATREALGAIYSSTVSPPFPSFWDLRCFVTLFYLLMSLVKLGAGQVSGMSQEKTNQQKWGATVSSAGWLCINSEALCPALRRLLDPNSLWSQDQVSDAGIRQKSAYLDSFQSRSY